MGIKKWRLAPPDIQNKAFFCAYKNHMRKQIGKKLRFEVFKRDGFICQYCGDHPPKAILHVDHIIPVADQGTNDIDNLITACQPCNSGKGARSLNSIPQSLAEKAKEIKEREAQLLGYSEVMQLREDRLQNESWEIIHDLFGEDVNEINKKWYAGIKVFVDKLGYYEVYDSVGITQRKIFRSDDNKFAYFCGVCWRKIKGDDRATG